MRVHTNSLTIYTINLLTLLNFTILYSKTGVTLSCLWNSDLVFGYHFRGGKCSMVVTNLHFHSPEGCLLPHPSTCPWLKSFLSLAYPNSFLLIYQVSDSLPHSSHSIPGNAFSTWLQRLPVCLTVQFKFSSSSLIYT